MRDKKPETNNELSADEQLISKSERKRQMHYLQSLGESLVELTVKQREAMELSVPLLEALQTADTLNKREAKRRHLQFIGKLMRKENDDTIKTIESTLNNLHQQKKRQTDTHHAIENWRDNILQQGSPAIECFIEAYPQAERQWLRQIVRQHAQEQSKNKPPAAARKLFDYVRQFVQA